MEQTFWPSSFESIKDQRNLKNWMSNMEELPGGPVSNLGRMIQLRENMTFLILRRESSPGMGT